MVPYADYLRLQQLLEQNVLRRVDEMLIRLAEQIAAVDEDEVRSDVCAAVDEARVYCMETLEELAKVLGQPRIRDKYHVTEADIPAILDLILLNGEHIQLEVALLNLEIPKQCLHWMRSGPPIGLKADQNLLPSKTKLNRLLPGQAFSWFLHRLEGILAHYLTRG